MSRPFILIGDPADHGGNVGKPVARAGGKVACRRYGAATIVPGGPGVVTDRRPLARRGDEMACATSISTQAAAPTG